MAHRNRLSRVFGREFAVGAQEVKLTVQADLQSHGVTQNQIESLAEIMHQSVLQEQIAGGSVLVAHAIDSVTDFPHGTLAPSHFFKVESDPNP